MFARVTVTQMKLDRLDDAIKLFAESVIPAAKAQKGFKDMYLLTDRTTGKGLAIGFWESEADADANEKSGYYQEQVSKFKDLFAAPPTRQGYEVSVQS
jgi:heme-degrading monooxygenase HmoA